MHTATATGQRDGRTFIVRLVQHGDTYGRNGKLTNDDMPLVEFYDTRHHDSDSVTGHLGQFVARFYLHTLLERPSNWALPLQYDVSVWTVTGESLATALGVLSRFVGDDYEAIAH